MSREINVKREEVIKALKKNKEQHVEDYKKAKELYQQEGLKQIAEISEKLKLGKTNLKLSLIEPINKEDWYDDKIKMFEMEVNDVVELEQHEFESLILDKDQQILMAKMSNTSYSSVR